jgi:ferric-dicitrate binding protein FerR (iron transport regulator)
MNGFEQHPDTELLDRLRAGLFDDNPQQRTRLEQHLRECADCRRAYDWPGSLRSTALPDAQLDALRKRALAVPAARRRYRLAPLAAVAALALAAVGLVSLLPSPQAPAPQLAVQEQAAPVPDLYEDLDFYLWLADHKGNPQGSGDSST